jgi:hypothetical protein
MSAPGSRKRISGPMFGVLFCVWILTAVVGIGISIGNGTVLIDPEGVQMSNDPAPFGPPPRRTSAAFWFALGVAMVVWPLPFCRGERSSRAAEGFGRG